jgi:uncharacterized Zn finger protein (UPF0148 family)
MTICLEPEDENTEPECDKCSDILLQDFFGDWFCPTCVRKEQEEAK